MTKESSAVEIAPGDNSTAAFDLERIRADFPILKQTVYGKPLVYLDNGASAQKPRQVIDAMTGLFENYYSNVHRGVHWTSQRSTEAYERAREKVAAVLKYWQRMIFSGRVTPRAFAVFKFMTNLKCCGS